MTTQPELGDLVFVRWPDRFSRLTEWFSDGLGAHVEQVCEDGAIPKTMTADRVMNRMMVWEWEGRKEYWAHTSSSWVRYSLVDPLDASERKHLHNFFQEAQGTYLYARGELVLQALDGLKNRLFRIPYDSPKSVWFRKAGDWAKRTVICSKSATLGIIHADKALLPDHAQYWSPADLLKWVRAHPAQWRLGEDNTGFYDAELPEGEAV